MCRKGLDLFKRLPSRELYSGLTSSSARRASRRIIFVAALVSSVWKRKQRHLSDGEQDACTRNSHRSGYAGPRRVGLQWGRLFQRKQR